MKLKRAMALLMLLAGAALLLGQPLLRLWGQRQQQTAVEEYRQAVTQLAQPQPEELTPPDDLLLEELRAYNTHLLESGQQDLKDPFAYEQPPFRLEDYGLPSQVYGVLWIPRIDQQLPLYLGAGKENLAAGAAILGGTSIPVGMTDTNCVIAGHRGYNGVPFLRDIQQVQLNDRIEITTPWETLVYRVCALNIIEPDDLEPVWVQPGRELVTLITCHPYPQNTHRYLVVAQRDKTAQPLTHQEELEEARATREDGPRIVTVIEKDGTRTQQTLSTGEGEQEAGALASDRYIKVERLLNLAGIGLLAVLALGWVISLIRNKRSKK